MTDHLDRYRILANAWANLRRLELESGGDGHQPAPSLEEIEEASRHLAAAGDNSRTIEERSESLEAARVILGAR